jgi:hypothetical protein
LHSAKSRFAAALSVDAKGDCTQAPIALLNIDENERFGMAEPLLYFNGNIQSITILAPDREHGIASLRES